MALLGLLYGAPGYGYDLHRKVILDLGQVWRLSQSQAYAILKRLEARRDIGARQVAQHKLPARQLYQITPQGQARFLAWLEAPSGASIRAIRLEFVTRLYFLSHYFPEKIGAAFARQRAEAAHHLQRLEETRSTLPPADLYNHMSLDLRLEQLRQTLAWLDRQQRHFLPAGKDDQA